MIYLRIKDNTQQARLILEFLKTLSFVDVIREEDLPNKTTLKAMKEVENGKVTKTSNVNDLLTKLNK